MDELQQTHERDQYHAARREEAVALARDAVAYRNALKEGGITGVLLTRMVEKFNAVWIGGEASDAGISIMYAETGDD